MDDTQSQSFKASIRALDVGKSLSISRLLTSDEVERGELGEIKASMRGRINPAVSRVRQQETSRTFRSDCGQFVTDTGAVIVTVAVTRTQ